MTSNYFSLVSSLDPAPYCSVPLSVAVTLLNKTLRDRIAAETRTELSLHLRNLHSSYRRRAGDVEVLRCKNLVHCDTISATNTMAYYDTLHMRIVSETEYQLDSLTRLTPITTSTPISRKRPVNNQHSFCSKRIKYELKENLRSNPSAPKQHCSSSKVPIKPLVITTTNTKCNNNKEPYAQPPTPVNVRRKTPLPDLAIQIMSAWYTSNVEHPYPSYAACEVLAKGGSVSVEQVKKWFANRRLRDRNTKTLAQIALRRVRTFK